MTPKHYTTFCRLFLLFLTAVYLGSCSGSAITPVISSEDGELDHGGHDLPQQPTNACTAELPKKFSLQVVNVDNGALHQEGVNSPTNPAILDIGQIYGPDKSELQTTLHLEFITDSSGLLVGVDPGFYFVRLHLILLDLSASTEMESDFVFNEPVYDSFGLWIGNRIALWNDPFALFDGLLELNQTYILQSCLGILLNPESGEPLMARSQPFYIKAQLHLDP